MSTHQIDSRITKLDSVTFDKLLQRQNPLRDSSTTLDLSGITFVAPAALTHLAATCFAVFQSGKRLTINVPDESVRNYLLRTGLLSAIEGVADIEPTMPKLLSRYYEHRRGSNPLLIELTKVDSGVALPPLLDQIVQVLRFRLRYKKYDAFDIATVVSELCQNTFDHNTYTYGFLAMQVFGNGTKPFLEIGVADFGDGLRTTLNRNAKNPPIQSDRAAIEMATKLGTSEHDDPTRGTGLYHLLEIAYRHSGAVQIRTGSSKIRYRMDRKLGWSFDVPHLPGVQVALSFSTKRF